MQSLFHETNFLHPQQKQFSAMEKWKLYRILFSIISNPLEVGLQTMNFKRDMKHILLIKTFQPTQHQIKRKVNRTLF